MSKTVKNSFFITYMEVKKALDTVWYNAILVLIYDQGIKGNLLNIYRDMYSDIRSQVKLKGELPREIKEWQGISQGGLTSTGLLKGKANPMLNRISSHPLAYTIGSIQVGAPMAADYTTIITSSRIGAQTRSGIHVAQCDANQQRYNFISETEKVMVINPTSQTND